MRNMKLSVKLILSFLIITAFSIILACVGIVSGVSVNGNYTYLLEGPIERQNMLGEMQAQFTMMRYRAANYVMEVNNPDIITGTLTPQYESAYAAFKESLDAYTKSNNEDSRRDPETIRANKGIDQVAQVVQQNSATAEQSAAASEEMSGQAGMLEELVAHFKLKGGTVRNTINTGASNKKRIDMPKEASHASDNGFGKY